MPGYSPYGSSVTSASSSVSGFGSSVQEYQTSSNPQYSNEYNCPTLLTVPAGYAGVFSPGTGQTSQANEFSGVPVQPNTNNYGAGYYIPGYYGWNWLRTWYLIGEVGRVCKRRCGEWGIVSTPQGISTSLFCFVFPCSFIHYMMIFLSVDSLWIYWYG